MKFKRLLYTILKTVTFIAILAFAPIVIFQQFSTENTMRFWSAILAPFLTIIFLLFWYGVFGKAKVGRRITRVTCILLFMVAAGALFGLLFEYKGSLGGSSLPKFGFRFSKEKTTDPDDVAKMGGLATEAGLEISIPDGVVDSPQFLGPNRDGQFPNSKVSLDFESNPPKELWRMPIGEGWSSFSVVGGRAFTQEQHGEDEYVTCYELMTGSRLWSHRDADTRFTTSVTEENKVMAVMGGEGTRATPTVFGDDVYSLGSTGILNCLELNSGALKWSRDTLKEFSAPLPKWGKSSAPLVIAESKIVVVTGAESGPTLMAYRLVDGEPAWEYEGAGASYSSPRLLEIAGVTQIVSVNAFDVTGHDPATGIELWKFPWPGANPKVCQPILIENDKVLISSGYGMGTHLLQIAKIDEQWSVASLWETIKLKTKFSSAVVSGGHAFGLNEGRLACIDLENGDLSWRGDKYKFGQNILIDDKILIQAEDGFVAVVKADSAEFTETARLETGLQGITWNVPTLAGRYLLIRNGNEAICYQLSAK